MSQRNSLILDVAGVLATNFSPRFWRRLEEETGTAYEGLMLFKKEIRSELWKGAISEEAFWTRLCTRFPVIQKEQAKRLLLSNIQPLPALEDISVWHEYADIHLLSNHRAEWVEPILAPIQRYVSSVTISSSVGCCKPNPDIYAHVHAKVAGSSTIWYVDDQEKNLQAARALGWQTILAGDDGAWRSRILLLISGQRR